MYVCRPETSAIAGGTIVHLTRAERPLCVVSERHVFANRDHRPRTGRSRNVHSRRVDLAHQRHGADRSPPIADRLCCAKMA